MTKSYIATLSDQTVFRVVACSRSAALTTVAELVPGVQILRIEQEQEW
jgi:hypothetical protein